LRKLVVVLCVLAIVILGTSCNTSSMRRNRKTNITPSNINPSDFVQKVDNPWFPLKPGSVYVYTGVKDARSTTDTFTVTNKTKKILGVTCTVVNDVLTSEGKQVEVTQDWYTQDKKGNVWYFGESTKELNKNGKVISTEGSWQAGVNGAQPGVFMPSNPKVGQTFRQEYLKGQAEDHFKIFSFNNLVKVPYGSFNKAMITKEWTPLEPDVIDHKYYVKGIGLVKEITVKGPEEESNLVSFRQSK
jgi:hypothetical protein